MNAICTEVALPRFVQPVMIRGWRACGPCKVRNYAGAIPSEPQGTSPRLGAGFLVKPVHNRLDGRPHPQQGRQRCLQNTGRTETTSPRPYERSRR